MQRLFRFVPLSAAGLAFHFDVMPRGYTGTLCSDCLPGYRGAKKGCQKCTDVETISSKRIVPWMRFVEALPSGEHANTASCHMACESQEAMLYKIL